MEPLSTVTEDGTEIFYNEITAALNDFIISRNIEDMTKEGQNRWTAALRYICKEVFKYTNKLKKDLYDKHENNNIKIITNNNAYDVNKLHKLADIYIDLCFEYDKEVSINGFCYLSGISKDIILKWGGKGGGYAPGIQDAGTAGLDLYKKLDSTNEETLSGMLISGGKRAPVAILGALNRRHGWNMGQPQEAQQSITVKSAAEIAEQYSGLIEEKPELPEL